MWEQRYKNVLESWMKDVVHLLLSMNLHSVKKSVVERKQCLNDLSCVEALSPNCSCFYANDVSCDDDDVANEIEDNVDNVYAL